MLKTKMNKIVGLWGIGYVNNAPLATNHTAEDQLVWFSVNYPRKFSSTPNVCTPTGCWFKESVCAAQAKSWEKTVWI